MDAAFAKPRFRGLWAPPLALAAAVAIASLIVVAELIGISVFMGSQDPVAIAREIPVWIVMPIIGVSLMVVSIVGLPTWALLHSLGAVHPGQGGLVGAVLGGLVTAVLLTLVLSSPAAFVFGLLGVLPGAAAGAIWLWVAYRPQP